jgi:hypothetical protein
MERPMTFEPGSLGPKRGTQGVAVADLADELGTYRATIFKIAKRLGVEPDKRRDASRGNQLIAVVAETDAAAIRATFTEGRRTGQGSAEMAELAPDEGMFYLVQLEPQHDPGRFKLGFTTDLDGRLRHHRCSAPFAQYLKTWPCRRAWERTAIDCLATDVDQLHTEVFRGQSLAAVAERGDRFFQLMPPVRGVPEAEDEPVTTEDASS